MVTGRYSFPHTDRICRFIRQEVVNSVSYKLPYLPFCNNIPLLTENYHVCLLITTRTNQSREDESRHRNIAINNPHPQAHVVYVPVY